MGPHTHRDISLYIEILSDLITDPGKAESPSSYCVGQDERFKFVDDLTILEIVNILTIGLSSINIKFQVPNDMKEDNQFIPSEHLESQVFLNKINSWTEDNLMKINKTK